MTSSSTRKTCPNPSPSCETHPFHHHLCVSCASKASPRQARYRRRPGPSPPLDVTSWPSPKQAVGRRWVFCSPCCPGVTLKKETVGTRRRRQEPVVHVHHWLKYSCTVAEHSTTYYVPHYYTCTRVHRVQGPVRYFALSNTFIYMYNSHNHSLHPTKKQCVHAWHLTSLLPTRLTNTFL
jgi:hypothetical protein